jgi:hypothetical protein
MRVPTLALVVTAVAVLGWSGVGQAVAAPPKCTDLGGVVDAAKTCQIQITDPQYSLKIGYPVDYPDTQPVYDYVKQTRDGFLNVARIPDSRDMPYELETKATEYGSDVPPRGTKSVVFETYQGVGGAHPTTFYKSFNWDQVLRKPITIDDLFREGTQPFPVILPLVEADLTRLSGQPVTIPPEVGLDPTKYANFALTDDSLIFFFSQGDLVAGAFGALQVTVPRGPVASMIN